MISPPAVAIVAAAAAADDDDGDNNNHTVTGDPMTDVSAPLSSFFAIQQQRHSAHLDGLSVYAFAVHGFTVFDLCRPLHKSVTQFLDYFFFSSVHSGSSLIPYQVSATLHVPGVLLLCVASGRSFCAYSILIRPSTAWLMMVEMGAYERDIKRCHNPRTDEKQQITEEWWAGRVI